MLLIPDKFSLQINMETVILSLIMTIGGGMTGKFGYRGAQAQEKTEKLLQSVSSMSEQEENSSVLNQITDRVQDLLKVAKQEV